MWGRGLLYKVELPQSFMAASRPRVSTIEFGAPAPGSATPDNGQPFGYAGERRNCRDPGLDLHLPFSGAYHAVLREHLGLSEIATFDRDFDRVPGIRRVEP